MKKNREKDLRKKSRPVRSWKVIRRDSGSWKKDFLLSLKPKVRGFD